MELAVAKLAFSTLSPIINKLGNYAYASNFGGDVTAEEMRYLDDFVRFKIMALIREVELNPSDQLRPLLENLQAAAFEAEDVLDLYEYKQIKYQVSSSPNPIKKYIPTLKEKLAFMLPKSPLRISLEKLLKFADEIEKLHPFIKSSTDITQQNYKSSQTSTSTSTETTANPSSPYFGRAEQCGVIIEFLLDESYANSNKGIKIVPIIAIQGLGGSGKTVTAQRVYNDDRIKIYFDLRMWIHVSRGFDVHRLTKEIIESAKGGECPQINNLNVLQEKLKESVSKRNKFLLVLDDIWCEDKMQWDHLLSPLIEVGGKGSKIIITTRMEEVASKLQVKKVIPLEELKSEECWSILKHYACNNHEQIIEDQELANVGNQIINKVKYSPLALRVVGSSLSKQRSVDEWKKILKRDMLKETRDVLLFSFQHLPSHLQRCFAYCSLFPKGYRFHFGCYHREQLLIPLWISQGFIENTSDQLTLEEEALLYIKELVSYSFFEMRHNDSFPIQDSFPIYDSFVIHDLLHDLAEEVSKKQCHRIEHKDSLDIPTTCIHLSIHRVESSESIYISNTLKLRYLRTLIILDDADSTNIFKNKKDIFQNLTKLRALYVESDRKMEVLSNPHIDKLKHLRYLHVDYDKKLPRSLVKLYHLQFFHLITHIDGEYLKANTLPQDFGNLINLRTLKFYSSPYEELDYLYYNSKKISIEKLKSLQNLSAFHPEKDSANGMMPLKNFPLCGSVRLLNLENVKSKIVAAEAMLNQKSNLNDLEFGWSSTSSSTDNSNTCEEVLEGLEPHSNLEVLKVKGYQGVKVANWMVKENWLPRLQTLILSSCKNLKEVPFLPPFLRQLVVQNCDELMKLPPVVSTLRTLELENCPNLMVPSMSNNYLHLFHLCIKRCSGNELFIELPFLTNLRILELEGFPNLQTLPKLSVVYLWIEDCSKLASLESLQYCNSLIIKKCPMLMRDESLLLDGVVEGDIMKPLSQIEHIITDEPLLVLVLVQQQAFSSIKSLELHGLQRPFPPLLEDHFHQLSSLKSLWLDRFTILPNLEKLSSMENLTISNCPDVELLKDHFHQLSSLYYLKLQGFTTLPNLEKLSSMEILTISKCPDVELLPNLPISLQSINVDGCPKLMVNYEEGGRLHDTISHIPEIFIPSRVLFSHFGHVPP